jgi:hypothetical protein
MASTPTEPAPGAPADRAPADPAAADSERWRGVVAALVNPRTRRALAEVIAGTDPPLSSTERREATRVLRRAGITTLAGRVDETGLRALLASGRPPAEQGIERWLRRDGRIDRWPRGEDDRRELLGWVAERLLGADEVVDEKELTGRLFPFTTDPNTLRRALVDAGLVTRNPDGTDYRRAVPSHSGLSHGDPSHRGPQS